MFLCADQSQCFFTAFLGVSTRIPHPTPHIRCRRGVPLPIRRHIPTGVLFDLIAGGGGGGGEERGGVGDAARDGSVKHGGAQWSGSSPTAVLPWRITVHFQGCPRRQV